MGSSLRLTLPGAPRGKVRHRSAIPWNWVFKWIASGKVGRKPIPHNYNDSRYEAWEDSLAFSLRVAWAPRPPLDEPCQLLLVTFFPRPKSRTRKTLPNPRYPHTSVPDNDNVQKAIQDALQKAGVVVNDSRIFDTRTVKWVCSGEESPRIELVLRWGSGCTLLR